jgi:hypothetical protein
VNNLLQSITFVEINFNELYAELKDERDSFKVEEFKRVIESYLSEKLANENPNNIRIVLSNLSKRFR